MLKHALAVLLIAGFAGSAGMEIGVPSAAAAVPVVSAPAAKMSSPLVQPVRWVYVDKKYGPRYRYRRPGYGYYYGGWWYPRPWWTVAVGPVVVGPGYIPAYGPRYRYLRPGYHYYHKGYYYHRRWW
jgi:hypothetical protein